MTVPAPVPLPADLFAHFDPPSDVPATLSRPAGSGESPAQAFSGANSLQGSGRADTLAFALSHDSGGVFARVYRFQSPADLDSLLKAVKPKEVGRAGSGPVLSFSPDIMTSPRPGDLIVLGFSKDAAETDRLKRLASATEPGPRAALALRCMAPLSGYPSVTLLTQSEEAEWGGPTARVYIPRPGGRPDRLKDVAANLFATACDSPQAAEHLAKAKAARLAEIVAAGPARGADNPFTYADAKAKTVWAEGDFVYTYWDFVARTGYLSEKP